MKPLIEILLIEDNPADAGLFSAFFEPDRKLCRFHLVNDGEEALDFLHARGRFDGSVRPHFIILDVNIPKIDGKEVLRTIKADASLRLIPVLVLTGSESEEDLRQCYALGANCVLIKPCDVDGVAALFAAMQTFWLAHVKYSPGL